MSAVAEAITFGAPPKVARRLNWGQVNNRQMSVFLSRYVPALDSETLDLSLALDSLPPPSAAVATTERSSRPFPFGIRHAAEGCGLQVPLGGRNFGLGCVASRVSPSRAATLSWSMS